MARFGRATGRSFNYCGVMSRTGFFVGFLLLAAPSYAAACIGDCNGDGRVQVDELVVCVDIGLGGRAATECPTLDDDENGDVSISELVGAVTSMLEGCPTTPTPTTTPTTTETPTVTSTPSVTPTPTVNLPPVLPTPFVYRTFPGFDIGLPLLVGDPNGDTVTCTADVLPAGATIDATSGRLQWIPSADQLGPFYVPYTCADDAIPSETAQGEVTLKVQPPDLCAMPDCDPALGCTVPLPPLSQNCCEAEPTVHVAEPEADCPQGRVVFSGRNQRGFGRLQNCDRLRVLNFQQTGAVLRFNIETRCFNFQGVNPVTIRTRLETATRVAVNDVDAEVLLDLDGSGYGRFYSLALPIDGGGPFFDLDGAEADLTVTITDVDGAVASNTTRVALTFDALPDLPEVE
jgi:Putative Ig domain